ncbi:hypothetical protein [Streptomyces violascens]|uniref:hypothetical protein n=1 Tax=Streptomyces violascens TaxID=67381 RepID=UPI0036C0870C
MSNLRECRREALSQNVADRERSVRLSKIRPASARAWAMARGSPCGWARQGESGAAVGSCLDGRHGNDGDKASQGRMPVDERRLRLCVRRRY